MVLKTYFKEYLDKKTYKQYDLYRDTQFYLTFFFFTCSSVSFVLGQIYVTQCPTYLIFLVSHFPPKSFRIYSVSGIPSPFILKVALNFYHLKL